MKWPNSTNNATTFENIKKDISDFANYNSMHFSYPSPGIMEASWSDRREEKSALFEVEGGKVRKVNYANGRTASYADFLASPYMADLAFAASQICRRPWETEHFVSEQAEYGRNTGDIKTLIDQRLSELQSGSADMESTVIAFVRANAGSGKTCAMRNAAMKCAREWEPGKPLYFYIDAQARSLARIEEAIAYETSILSVAFQARALHALVRNMLMVPIIDGFDELIGSGGYEEAFLSLATLLATLESQGLIVVTGRSTFYDDNIMRIASNAQNCAGSLNYMLEDIILRPWQLEDIIKYINNKYKDPAECTKLRKIFERLDRNTTVSELLSKPFYAVRLAETLAKENEAVLETQTTAFGIIELIINSYLAREANEKFLDRAQVPMIDIVAHKTILKELALELWWQEQRVIERDTLDSIVEMVLEQNQIRAELWSAIKTKMWSYSFFGTSNNARWKEFENQLYYNFFLMQVIPEVFNESEDFTIRKFLERSLLDNSVLEFLEPTLWAVPNPRDLGEKLEKSMRKAPTGSLGKRNAGAILAELVQIPDDAVLEINDMLFHGCRFNKPVKNIRFINCDFRDCELYDRFEECTFINCRILGAKIGDDFRLSNSLVDGDCLFVRKKAAEPLNAEELKKFGASVRGVLPFRELDDVQEKRLDVLKRFFDKTRRCLQFSLKSEDEVNLREILISPQWGELQRILEKSGILERRDRDRSGQDQYLFTITEDRDETIRAIIYNEYCQKKKIRDFCDMFLEL